MSNKYKIMSTIEKVFTIVYFIVGVIIGGALLNLIDVNIFEDNYDYFIGTFIGYSVCLFFNKIVTVKETKSNNDILDDDVHN